MKRAQLSEMQRGWFIGDFEPAVLRSQACEVAVRHYAAGASEALHHHRVAIEVTVVVAGEVEMRGQCFQAGDIVTIAPGEATAFRALTDAICVVVKTPSVVGDKFLG